MSKYDCTKTLDYVHEKKRMCSSFKACFLGCPLDGEDCVAVNCVRQYFIDTIQKWSDEHPEKTRKEAFFEMFPNAAGKGIDKGIPVICYQHLVNNDKDFCQDDYKCRVCWNKPYNGEFEEAREEK